MPLKTQSFISQHHSIPLITAIKMTLSGLIAFLLVDYFNLSLGVWCVVTIAAVTQTGLDQTLVKSLMRAIGTISGAFIGYAIALFAKNDPLIIFILVFTMIFITSYIALQPTIYSYAGIVMGMTISIIVFFGLTGGNIYEVSVDRTMEVLLGIAILTFINFLLYFIVKRFFPAAINKTILLWHPPQFKVNKQYFFPALKVAFASMIAFLIWYYFKQPEGYWAVITCLLIMEENQSSSLKKGLFRFSSHFFAAIIGLICVLLLLHLPHIWKLVPLCIVFFICGFLIGTKNKYAGMGNTLGIAVTIMLLSNPGTHESIQVIFYRFYNVMLGVFIAFSVLFLKKQPDFLKRARS